jgi:hypothetical protein
MTSHLAAKMKNTGNPGITPQDQTDSPEDEVLSSAARRSALADEF